MKTETIFMCVVALILWMLMANMLKNVCGCKSVVEGATPADQRSLTLAEHTIADNNNCKRKTYTWKNTGGTTTDQCWCEKRSMCVGGSDGHAHCAIRDDPVCEDSNTCLDNGGECLSTQTIPE